MYEFRSVGRFEMPGANIVFAFEKSQIPEGMTDLRVLKGEVVRIDGLDFTVVDVDAHPVSENDHSTVPEDFGLMVKPAS